MRFLSTLLITLPALFLSAAVANESPAVVYTSTRTVVYVKTETHIGTPPPEVQSSSSSSSTTTTTTTTSAAITTTMMTTSVGTISARPTGSNSTMTTFSPSTPVPSVPVQTENAAPHIGIAQGAVALAAALGAFALL